jgi:hypothetical protein
MNQRSLVEIFIQVFRVHVGDLAVSFIFSSDSGFLYL